MKVLGGIQTSTARTAGNISARRCQGHSSLPRPGSRLPHAVGIGESPAQALAGPASVLLGQRFGVFGGSGGGPHALACAALLADRVTRCAVLSGIKPADPGVAHSDETTLSSRLAARTAEVMAQIDAGGPEVPAQPGPAARTDPDAMARIRATFVDGTDGWVDDSLAFTRPWQFAPEKITVPVGIWRGTHDTNVPGEHADWLLAHIPTAQGHVYDGGHLPGAPVYRHIYDWLHPDALHPDAADRDPA